MAVFHGLADNDLCRWMAAQEDYQSPGPRANGSDVLITGVATRPDLEREFATVVGFDHNKKAYIICVIENSSLWMISGDNLIDDPDSTQ